MEMDLVNWRKEKKEYSGYLNWELPAPHPSSLISAFDVQSWGLVTPDFSEATLHDAEFDKVDKILLPSLPFSGSAFHSSFPILGEQLVVLRWLRPWFLEAIGQGSRGRGMSQLLSYIPECWAWPRSNVGITCSRIINDQVMRLQISEVVYGVDLAHNFACSI